MFHLLSGIMILKWWYYFHTFLIKSFKVAIMIQDAFKYMVILSEPIGKRFLNLKSIGIYSLEKLYYFVIGLIVIMVLLSRVFYTSIKFLIYVDDYQKKSILYCAIRANMGSGNKDTLLPSYSFSLPL